MARASHELARGRAVVGFRARAACVANMPSCAFLPGAQSRMATRILVPIDFSPCSDAALEHALAIADDDGDGEVDVL